MTDSGYMMLNSDIARKRFGALQGGKYSRPQSTVDSSPPVPRSKIGINPLQVRPQGDTYSDDTGKGNMLQVKKGTPQKSTLI